MHEELTVRKKMNTQKKKGLKRRSVCKVKTYSCKELSPVIRDQQKKRANKPHIIFCDLKNVGPDVLMPLLHEQKKCLQVLKSIRHV